MLSLPSEWAFNIYSKKGTEATEAQNGQNTGKFFWRKHCKKIPKSSTLDLKLYFYLAVHIHRKEQTCRLARSHTHTDRYSQTISESAKIQTEQEVNYCTSKVGQSAEPSHWHFPLPGSLTQLKKIRYLTVKLSGCVRNSKCYLQRLSVRVCVKRKWAEEQELPSVCVVWSQGLFSVSLSRCLRPSALRRWSGPDGSSCADWPDAAVPTNACSDFGCKDVDVQQNVC